MARSLIHRDGEIKENQGLWGIAELNWGLVLGEVLQHQMEEDEAVSV